MTLSPYGKISGDAVVGGCNPGTGWTNAVQVLTGYSAAINGDGVTASAAAGTLTVSQPGLYEVSFTAATTPTAVAHELTFTIQQNDTGSWVNIPGAFFRHTTVSAVKFSCAIHTLVFLTAGKAVRVGGVSSNAGPQDHVTTNLSLTIRRVA